MLLLGYHAGHWLETMVERVETYHETWPMTAVADGASTIGALVLAAVGVNMVKQNITGGDRDRSLSHPLHGLALVVLATSVSIDALAAGFSMGMMEVDLVKLSIILGAVIFSIAVISLALGRKFGRLIGSRAELAGGLVLILLSAHALWKALLA